MGTKVPIIVRFIEHNVEQSDIPGIHSLSKEIQDCVQQVESGNERGTEGCQGARWISPDVLKLKFLRLQIIIRPECLVQQYGVSHSQLFEDQW